MIKNGFSYAIREQIAGVSMQEYLRECVDVPRFLSYCRACPNYGRIWSCPPYDFDPMSIWNQYGAMLLYARILIPEGQKRELEAAVKALCAERSASQEKLLRWEASTPGSRALAGGSCLKCVCCSRPERECCRNPEWMRYSIESLGGDVGKTAERWLGKKLQWIQGGVVPDYLMVIGALLLPKGRSLQSASLL